MQLYDSRGNRMYGAWKSGFRVARHVVLAFIVAVGILSLGAATQINLTSQVQGVLPTANGGTGQNSTATFPASGTVMTTGTGVTCSQMPALSGNATSVAGACATTVVSVNGTTIPVNSAADQLINTTASATGQWTAIPNCTGALQYSTSTHTFSCGAVLTGTFVDAETPSGSCPTTTLTLANAPSPATSLTLYKNGQRLIVGASADYTLSSSTITLASSCSASPADLFIANYRH